MSVAIVCGIIFAVLFGASFLTKRRFGVLGLALAAGSILGELWTKDVTEFVYGAGVDLVSPPLATVVGAVLVLLPAAVLLFRGPTNKDMMWRVIGAVAFGLLALAFLLPTLGEALVLEGDGKKFYDIARDYQSWIITAGLIFAVVDIMATKTPKDHHKEK